MSLPIAIPFLLTLVIEAAPAAPAMPPRVTKDDAPALERATAFVRGLSDEALEKMVPTQSGLFFVGCPNCKNGRQENQLDWTTERPDEVFCRYCNHRYPSDKYPMDKAVTVRNPRGEVQRYPYWEDARGYRYFLMARRDSLVREYLADRTHDLALLYLATGDKAHARRAALLLDRFAQVFPGWCYHYDLPFRQKEIYDGDVPPAKFRPGYRTARWTWWAYSDIPVPLVQAYDWIRPSGVLDELSRQRGVDVSARVERDLIKSAADQVLANRDEFSNMDPSCWRSVVIAGRVLGQPRYVHEVAARFRGLVQSKFFYDGSWCEGAPSYGSQTLGGLSIFLDTLRGYSDPPNYRDQDGTRFDDFDLAREFPILDDARVALAKLRTPDGRPVAVHDTWRRSFGGGGGRRSRGAGTRPNAAKAAASPSTDGSFLLPALGHAALAIGVGPAQTQVQMTWSGGYGHQHGDNLSIFLFGEGRELLSDLGYSHTAYRSWTLATAAHNTVVIDGKSQYFGGLAQPSDGSLQLYDTGDRRVHVVSADGTRGYPKLAKTYRRTLVLVDSGASEGRGGYAVDFFQVEGGKTHDYLLHGEIDHPVTVSTNLMVAPLARLLPAGFEWKPTENEGEVGRAQETYYAYGFFRNLKSAPAPAGAAVHAEFRSGPTLQVHLLPEPNSQLVLGENPSVSPAGEDDAQLDKHLRPFLMLRHEARDGRSAFAAVMEPYAQAPMIRSVERLDVPGAALALRVRLGDRDDLVVIGAGEAVRLEPGSNPATFQGSVGVLSRRGAEVEHAYALGGSWTRGAFKLEAKGPQHLPLASVADHALVLAGKTEAPPHAGDVVRVVTADGWVYPYTVADVESQSDVLRLRTVEACGLKWDTGAHKLALTMFPQREHTGAVRVEWVPRASR